MKKMFNAFDYIRNTGFSISGVRLHRCGVVFSIALMIIIQIILLDNPCRAHDRESPVVQAVRRVGPAVVNISSEVKVRKRRHPFSGFGMNPFFDSFFKDFFDSYQERRPSRSTLGSGVIIDGRRGLIITNAHVIANAGAIKVVLQDEHEYEAEIVGADPDYDLAVLRIATDKALPDIAIGSSENLMIGETVIAIGNPFGFSNTVTTGVISALNRSIRTDDRVFHEFIQIDASINPGNSGGPLLNINGELIGINTAIYAKAQGIGFAIPISKAEKIISDLIEHGKVIEAWIGITVQNIDTNLARYLNVPQNSGVIIKGIEAGSPAAKAGLREGDIILSIENRLIVSDDDYQTAMGGFGADSRLKVKVWRDESAKTIHVTASEFPASLAQELGYRLLGVTVENLSTANRRRYDIMADKGIVITELHPDSFLASIGAEPGDVLRRMNQIRLRSVEDFNRAVVKYRHKNSVIVLLQRADQAYYITVEL
jgi:Do/DeqQ family serine protease